MRSTTETGETRFLSSITTSSIRSLLPMRSMSSSKRRNPEQKLNPKTRTSMNSENTPPPHPNIQIDTDPSPQNPPPLKAEIVGPNAKSDLFEEGSDPAVKVVVRIRSVNEHEREGLGTVTKISSDSLSVEDRKFTFDCVFDSSSNQEDLFRSVGVPLVKSALAGYNASILSYGQTGSGKTYTMWGPPSAMVEDPLPCSHQGIAPRMFQLLFSEIQREQENSEGKQINYQCRCSFLEIYNEQIGDLLDPMQRNLEIKDDPKNGLHVENLTEEYVSSYEDVTQILIKGLSARKVGATSINSKSSRSHIIFTLIMESWCKGSSSSCFNSSKISRISLVDLAGLDRNKVDDVSKELARESKYVKKSLSHLGLLVNILAKGIQPGRREDLPFEGSCLTHLLRDSLGGNAKLSVVCSISPGIGNNAETLRTLRFGKRVKSIKNEPVINEISEDDVNDLSDQIRQLKEELVRAKSDVRPVGSKNEYFRGQNARETLNQLKVSLNRSLIFPEIDNDSDNELSVDEDDVRELHEQLDKLHNTCGDAGNLSAKEENFENDLMSEDEVMNDPDEIQNEDINLERHLDCVSSANDLLIGANKATAVDPGLKRSISISLCQQSAVLLEPTLSESPKIGNTRKSMANSSAFSANLNNASESTNLKSDVLLQSVKQSERLKSSLRSSKMFTGPTECLAASLQRGLEVIGQHQQNSALNRSSVSFSFEHLALKPCPEVEKTEDLAFSDGPSASVLCASCQRKIGANSDDIHESLKRSVVPIDEVAHQHQSTHLNTSSNVGEATGREKELESICKEQASRIEQLQQLVEQYKYERELIKDPQNQIMLIQDLKNEDNHLSNGQNKISQASDAESDQPDIVKEKCEEKEIQEVLHHGNTNTGFDVNEKEALLQEIQCLRTKLNIDASTNKSTEKLRSSLLAQSIQLGKCVDARPSTIEEFERERERWTEMESEWISFTDGLRMDLEASRQHSEKVEMELKSEKKCNEELDDALSRAVLGHARMVEHYAEIQEKYNDLVGKHRAIMEGVAEIKKAAAKAGTKSGTRFAKAVAAELSATRMEKEREREFLKKENKSLKAQLRDTAEAVHAAGELLVRLRESEQAASVAEENLNKLQDDNDKLKKQIENLKRKHKMEMITMKQYMAESKLPESALQPLYQEDSDAAQSTMPYDDQAWRAEFGAIYQEHL